MISVSKKRKKGKKMTNPRADRSSGVSSLNPFSSSPNINMLKIKGLDSMEKKTRLTPESNVCC